MGIFRLAYVGMYSSANLAMTNYHIECLICPLILFFFYHLNLVLSPCIISFFLLTNEVCFTLAFHHKKKRLENASYKCTIESRNRLHMDELCIKQIYYYCIDIFSSNAPVIASKQWHSEGVQRRKSAAACETWPHRAN